MRIIILLFIFLLVGCLDDKTAESEHDHEAETTATTANYLLITQAEQASLQVLDLDSESIIATLNLLYPAEGIYASPEGGYALIRHEEEVEVVNTYLSDESHEEETDSDSEEEHDHDHALEEDEHEHEVSDHLPELMDLVITGTHPHHFSVNGETGALFFDGDEEQAVSASVVLLTDETLAENTTITTIDLGIAMHGVAEPFGNYLLVSYKEPEYEGQLPNQVALYESHEDHYDFITILSETCPDLHGSATNSQFALFGCSDGVLMIDIENGEIHTHKIANPEDFPANTRIRHIHGHSSLDHFIGFASPGYFFLIEPDAETITAIDWEQTEVVDYILDSEGEHLAIFDTAS